MRDSFSQILSHKSREQPLCSTCRATALQMSLTRTSTSSTGKERTDRSCTSALSHATHSIQTTHAYGKTICVPDHHLMSYHFLSFFPTHFAQQTSSSLTLTFDFSFPFCLLLFVSRTFLPFFLLQKIAVFRRHSLRPSD